VPGGLDAIYRRSFAIRHAVSTVEHRRRDAYGEYLRPKPVLSFLLRRPIEPGREATFFASVPFQRLLQLPYFVNDFSTCFHQFDKNC